MTHRTKTLQVPPEDRLVLERWIRAGTTPQRLVLRSRIVLLLGEGLSGRAIARSLHISRHTVDLWSERYEKGGCEALVKTKPGRRRRGPASNR